MCISTCVRTGASLCCLSICHLSIQGDVLSSFRQRLPSCTCCNVHKVSQHISCGCLHALRLFMQLHHTHRYTHTHTRARARTRTGARVNMNLWDIRLSGSSGPPKHPLLGAIRRMCCSLPQKVAFPGQLCESTWQSSLRGRSVATGGKWGTALAFLHFILIHLSD